jgi:hypothetical protein
MFQKINQILKPFRSFSAVILCALPVLIPVSWDHTDPTLTITQYSEKPKFKELPLSMNSHEWPMDDSLTAGDPEELPVPEFKGIVIDDLSPQFSRQGPERYWHEQDQGFENHSWWTQNNRNDTENVARWSLGITQAGTYEVFVYIPITHATTRNAIYIVSHNGEQERITVNQESNHNSWYKIGAFSFTGTGDGYIELIDETGEADTDFEIAFDAVGYRSTDSNWEEKVTGALWERFRPWLDEKTALLEQTFKDWLNEQKGKLLQKLSDTLKNWIDQQCAGMGAALLFPLFALVLWQRQKRRKPPGSN